MFCIFEKIWALMTANKRHWIGLHAEGTLVRENWLSDWKTGINIWVLWKKTFMNWLLVYWGITAPLLYTFGVLDASVVVLRFEDQIMGSKLFRKYLISWVEIQEVQFTLTNCQKNLNLFSIHFHKICWQQKIKRWPSQYHLSLVWRWLDASTQRFQ